jgi:hypothetical protein
MTTAPEMTLVQFFDFDNAKARKEGLNALYGTQTMRSVQALLAGAPQLLQNHVAQSVTEALSEALKIKITDLAIAGWTNRREFAQYLDQTKFPRDEIVDHVLGKHEIFSSHKPRLQIMLDGSPIGSEFEFEISVKLALEAATLRVQDGRMMFARIGKVTGTGFIKCEDTTLFARAAKPVSIPQTLSFGTGLAIVPAKTAPKEGAEPPKGTPSDAAAA